MISKHHRPQQQQSRRKSTSPNAKSGYLVQRLHSLRSADLRMAMRLRSGQYSTIPGSSHNLLVSRKRRRSGGGGGDYLDSKNSTSSILDVTVSGASLSNTAFGEGGTTVLLAFIHVYTATKHPAGHCVEPYNGMTVPCFARIVISRDVLRERDIDDGCIKQLRFYDAVVIPSRLPTVAPEDAAAKGLNHNHELCMRSMPTIICTHICQDYPPEQPPLEDVSFDHFHHI